jgi:hypothetical protein
MIVEARHLGKRRGGLDSTASHINVSNYIVGDLIC